ncbi:MAG: glycosyltransferase family 4 protein [Propionibacterium sp.]|nr:glycosyltransferase family 4 protein [Propionibacterium sp.]
MADSSGSWDARRILHFTTCDTGGVPLAIRSLVDASPALEHYVLAPGGDFGTNCRDVFATGSGATSCVRALRQAVARTRPDLIHAHSSRAGVISRVIPNRVPVVYQPHALAFERGAFGLGTRLAARSVEWALARRTAAFVALSQHEADMISHLCNGARVGVVPNIPTRLPRAGSSVAALQEAPFRVVMAGRIAPQKWPEIFAMTAEVARCRGLPVEFRWIGDGDVALRHLLEKAGVAVTGWCNTNAVFAEMESASVYLHCSRYEGFPLAPLDAMAAGLPVIGTPIPALTELGVPTFREPEALLAEVLELCANLTYRQASLDRNGSILSQRTAHHLAEAVGRVYQEALR